MKITNYSFGRINIEGDKYTSDLIILPEKIISNWWRERGHELQISDLTPVFDCSPVTLVIGTGKMGMMKVRNDLKNKLVKENIDYFIDRTEIAVDKFNQQLKKEKETAAALHLTC